MQHCRFSPSDIDKKCLAVSILECVLLVLLVGYLFFDTARLLVLLPVVVPFLYRRNRREQIRREREIFKSEFRDILLQISGNLHAGYSLEQAFCQVKYEDMSRGMKRQILYIQHGLSCNQSVGELFSWWARESSVEEVQELADLVNLAKQYGGNLPFLLRQLAGNLSDVGMVDMEIQTLITAKKLEGKIMLLVPFGIMTYLRLVNREYIETIYTTTAGHVLMTICLLVIVGAGMMIERIIRIEV